MWWVPGSRTTVDVAGGRSLKDTDCTFCGQCVTHCPTGALTARDDTNTVLDALADPNITTIVQVAPAGAGGVGGGLRPLSQAGQHRPHGGGAEADRL